MAALGQTIDLGESLRDSAESPLHGAGTAPLGSVEQRLWAYQQQTEHLERQLESQREEFSKLLEDEQMESAGLQERLQEKLQAEEERLRAEGEQREKEFRLMEQEPWRTPNKPLNAVVDGRGGAKRTCRPCGCIPSSWFL